MKKTIFFLLLFVSLTLALMLGYNLFSGQKSEKEMAEGLNYVQKFIANMWNNLDINTKLGSEDSILPHSSIKGLVERNGVFYKKFNDVPFSGKISGREQGKFKKGYKNGMWRYYYTSGALPSK